MAEAGGLTSYGPSFPGLFRRAAEFVDKILREATMAVMVHFFCGVGLAEDSSRLARTEVSSVAAAQLI